MYDHSVSPDYRKYMKSRVWKDRKRRYFERHPRKCEACDRRARYRPWWKFWIKRVFIVLHHVRYDEQIECPGSEPDDALRALCSPGCHQEVHARYRAGQFSTLLAATEYVIEAKQAKLARQREKLQRSISLDPLSIMSRLDS
jgi:hypothetical protein